MVSHNTVFLCDAILFNNETEKTGLDFCLIVPFTSISFVINDELICILELFSSIFLDHLILVSVHVRNPFLLTGNLIKLFWFHA